MANRVFNNKSAQNCLSSVLSLDFLLRDQKQIQVAKFLLMRIEVLSAIYLKLLPNPAFKGSVMLRMVSSDPGLSKFFYITY